MWKKRHTVLLEGAACDSSQLTSGHCGRGCLLFWNEAWLERMDEPDGSKLHAEPGDKREDRQNTGDSHEGIMGCYPERKPFRRNKEGFRTGAVVRVRPAEQIAATLNKEGMCGGVKYVPEHMGGYCGSLRIVSGIVDRYYDERDDDFIELEFCYTLRGATCSGLQGGGKPRCDRLCSLIWHRSWLEGSSLGLS